MWSGMKNIEAREMRGAFHGLKKPKGTRLFQPMSGLRTLSQGPNLDHELQFNPSNIVSSDKRYKSGFKDGKYMCCAR
jgi:hypothetical protein